MSDAVPGWLFGGWLFGPSGKDELAGRARRTPRADALRTGGASSGNATDGTDRSQEREWIAGIRAGHVDVFRTVFETYARRLQQFAQIWVSRDVAEDIVQDILFDLWQRRADLHPHHDNLTGHLFAAVRNRTVDYLRHHQLIQRIEKAQTGDQPPGMGMGPRNPDSDVMAADLRATVASALSTLSELQRAALMLRWVQDMPFAQIAAVLSISENAAKLHVSRGRQVLAPFLKVLLDE
jgi:RNA polymerase sigma-70 factor (ECF subfamily)